MPRTILSTANNASEHRTLVLARKEMLSWTQFQLEPSALRSPDPYHAPTRILADGRHLPAALHALVRSRQEPGADVLQEIANRLAELFENVRSLRIDDDRQRELRSVVLSDLAGIEHRASSLSDGTLRFLALSVLEAGSGGPSVLCLEEPENGIHPDRVPAMIRLLRDIAVDTHFPVGDDNPMRQVIVNTHSPVVMREVPDDTILIADASPAAPGLLRLRGLRDTWRDDGEAASVLPLLSYLQGVHRGLSDEPGERRLEDRSDVAQLGLFEAAS